MAPPHIKLLFVDDDEPLTAAWERLISFHDDIEIVGICRNADGLTDTARSLSPDVVVIDLTMHGRDPLAAIEELSRERPATRIVVCSGRSKRDWETAARAAGAVEFIDKSDSPDQIIETIRRVARAGAGSPSVTTPPSR